DPEPDLYGSVSKTRSVTFSDCVCPLPTADAGGPYIETLVCEDGDFEDDDVEVAFSGSASGVGTFTYDWNFGDGGTSTLQNPTHTYAGSSGSPYTVTLTVTGDGENSCGSDTDTTSVNINYEPCDDCDDCEEDGYNDCFTVESWTTYDSGNDQTTFHFEICDLNGSDCAGLSHWIFGTETSADFCISASDIVSISPESTSIGYDGSTGYYGIKWENDLPGDGECKEFTIVLEGCRTGKSSFMVILKYGTTEATFDVCGPTCE
ncbi:MAG: PKD domain-containing protein, partial [Candidatus Caldatribacteriota bacterium]|nr:PKD domain-containing protein [Candidatus Caldatribacteriota bacterium]